MKNTLLQIIVLTGLTGTLTAAPMAFDFKDPKGVNNATFKLDAPLEAIAGSANGISGTVTFDPDKPDALKGKIVVDATSLHVGNPMMKGHLHGDQWLDTAKHKEISFVVTSVKNVKSAANATTAEVTGPFTLKGVTKEITVPVKITYLKDKLKARFPKLDGDLLVLRANFTIKRSDFGIQSGQHEEKVSNEIELSLSIAGMAPKS